MSRFYVFFVCGLISFCVAAKAQENIEPQAENIAKNSQEEQNPAANQQMQQNKADLFLPEELDFKIQNGAEIVYLKTGELFTGAVVLPNEQKEDMTYFYKNGKKNGTAISYDAQNNVKLEISYDNGMKSGTEMAFFANGKPKYQRNYYDDKLNGEEIIFFANGLPQKRTMYKNNVLDGLCRIFDEEGRLIKTENYKNGLKDGIEQIIKDNHLVQENVYKNGKLDGVIKKFNEKYLLEEISYKEGLQDGIHKIYSEKGGVSEISYVAGKRNGPANVYFANKKPAQKVQYVNDEKNGLSVLFYQDGSPSAIENYKGGKLDGTARYFDKEGKLTKVKYFLEGSEMAVVDIAADTTLKTIYEAILQNKIGQYTSKRNLWYTILWLALNTGQEELLQSLEKEMKMYALSLDDMMAYQKYSTDFNGISKRLFFGLTPFSYAVNLSAPVEVLQRFVSQINLPNERGTTALEEAVRLNNAEMVKYLLLQNAVSNDLSKMLFFAIKNETQPAIIELLLQNKAEVSIVDANKETPLMYAIKHKQNPQIIILLLNAGAKVDIVDNNGNTPLMYAIRNNMPSEVIRKIIQSGADINQKDKNGDTLLMYAIKNNAPQEDIEQLVQYGADVNIADKEGVSPLAQAIKQNQYDLMELLLNKGADVNTSLPNDMPILLYAFSNSVSNKILFSLLQKSVDINQQDAKGNTILLKALQQHNIPLVKELLARNADVNLRNKNGENALTYVLTHQVDSKLRNLIVSQNADISQKMADGSTVIWHYLLKLDDVELIKSAFGKVSDIMHLRDENGQTPLDVVLNESITQPIKEQILSYVKEIDETTLKQAVLKDDADFFAQILKLHQSPTTAKINGESLLSYIAIHHFNPEYLDILSQIGFNFNEENTQGKTVLDECVLSNNEKCAMAMIHYGADINHISNDRSNLMNLLGTQTTITKQFLELKPDISHVTQNGETALMAAAKNMNKPLVEYLLAQGADVNAEDIDGNTALMYLAKKQNTIKQPEKIYQKELTNIISMFLNTSINLNHRNIDGETALILFAKHNPNLYPTIRNILIAEGAEVRFKDQYGKTADDYFNEFQKKQ